MNWREIICTAVRNAKSELCPMHKEIQFILFVYVNLHYRRWGFDSYFFYPFYRLRNGLKFSRVLELPEVRSLRFDEHVNSSCWSFLKIFKIGSGFNFENLWHLTDIKHSSEEISTWVLFLQDQFLCSISSGQPGHEEIPSQRQEVITKYMLKPNSYSCCSVFKWSVEWS